MLEKCLKKTEERRTIGSNPKHNEGKIHTNKTGDLAQVTSWNTTKYEQKFHRFCLAMVICVCCSYSNPKKKEMKQQTQRFNPSEKGMTQIKVEYPKTLTWFHTRNDQVHGLPGLQMYSKSIVGQKLRHQKAIFQKCWSIMLNHWHVGHVHFFLNTPGNPTWQWKIVLHNGKNLL